MKNKWMKKILVLMMCGALAVPAAGMAQPMVAQATSPAAGDRKSVVRERVYVLV